MGCFQIVPMLNPSMWFLIDFFLKVHCPLVLKTFQLVSIAMVTGDIRKIYYTDKHKFYVWNSYVGFSETFEKRLKI